MACSGVSAFIAPTGKIHQVLEERGRRRVLSGLLIDRVQLDDRRTFYGRHGDVFAWAHLVFCAVLAAGDVVRASAFGPRPHDGRRPRRLGRSPRPPRSVR
jgi:apolipoprotein N-acyltransferase